MRLPFFSIKRRKPAREQGLEWVRSLFAKFQRIQKHNTKVLEIIAEMDRALGGEYIFDRAFLESSVRELGGLVHQVAYSLNAMSGDRYADLFDRYQSIKDTLDDILAGGPGPLGSSPALPYSILGSEMEPLAGALNACLAEARNRLDIAAPDGFAVTVAGCRTLAEAVEGDFPPELKDAIESQIKALFERRGGATTLSVRACSRDENFEALTGIDSRDVLGACKLALAKAGGSKDALLCLAVHEDVSAYVTGSVFFSVTDEFPSGLFRVTASTVETPDLVENYLVRGTYPFDILESGIYPKPAGRPIHPGVKPLSNTRGGIYRGSALVGPSFLRRLAACARAFERILGYPQNLGWSKADGERPVILSVSPAGIPDGPTGFADDPADWPAHADVVLTGGETVQTGVAAGPVVHVSEDNMDRFPRGAVAVAREADPKLSVILRRASAVITEIGASIGHLATIARELRVPAVFGISGAMDRLPEGLEITVDAGEKTVYRGIVEHLFASREWSTELFPTDPEYVTLRRLLRWIMPLDLIDPDSEEFSVRNCRTYHDIIHFAHERSIEELLKLQDYTGLKSRYVQKLQIEAPIDLFVLDLGGGLSHTSQADIRIDDVKSKPFAAFLRGLSRKETWDREPGSIGFKDIISGLERTFSAMIGAPEYSGRNHAIVAENYMNVGLRLGYHYSVIDSYLSENVNRNYVYFRFAGGFADERRRRRRAEFIRSILEQLRFKVTVKGDLVVGKLKIADSREVVSALGGLGELTGFTRQIDLEMDSENKVEQFTRLFREKAAHIATPSGEEERARA